MRYAWPLLLLLVGCGGGGGGFVGVPAEQVPNLRAEPASSLRVVHEDVGAGVQRLLRLSSRVSNYGDGRMEIHGEIQGAPHGQDVPASQVIYWNNGQTTVSPAGFFQYHEEHHHWHWDNLVAFRLHQVANPVDPYDPANSLVAATHKVSFCLLDSHRIPGFAGAASRRYIQCNQNRQGISRGWTDLYEWSLPGQWIVIDGVPDGLYWVILESDPESLLRETEESDNRSAVKVQLTGDTVTVVP